MIQQDTFLLHREIKILVLLQFGVWVFDSEITQRTLVECLRDFY
jgi:hypothetical protein